MATKTVDYKEKVVVANDRASLLSVATKPEQRNQELFFKYRLRYRDDYAGELRKGDLRIHKKSTSDFNGIALEFTMLCDIYNVVPGNVATPIALVRRSELGEYESAINSINGYSVAGYITEYIAGQTLAAYYEKAIFGTPIVVEEFTALARQLIEVLNKLNKEGIGHGDANFRNVIVTNNGVLKLIDPLPLNQNLELARVFAIGEDTARVSNMTHMIRHMVKNRVPD